jgi:hypothetical protein
MQVSGSGRRIGRSAARLSMVVLTTAAVAGGVGPTSAGAAISGLCGTVATSPMPPSIKSDASEDSGKFQLFPESRQLTLATPVLVDITQPGLYDQPLGLTLPLPVILPGTVVSSYLLHSDPVGQPKPGTRMTAVVNFNQDILGVMVQSATLAASDTLLGLNGVTYPAPGEDRGLELAPKVDFVRVTGPRSLEVTVLTGTVSDEVRVVTAGAGDSTGPSAGYEMVATDGGVFPFGNDQFLGSTGAQHLNSPVVAAAAPCGHNGYWLAAADGGVFNFGDAAFYGSLGSTKLNAPVVGMASTQSGKGYWLAAADGGVFNFGDATFRGSAGSIKLQKPIVGMAATPTGKGYWLVASDGGIFSYGDAGFFGSTGAIALNKPIVGMAATPTGKGYWLVASDGGIFSFGDALFRGSTGAMTLNKPIVDMVASPSGNGYWLVASDGGIFSFGDATFYGSTGAITLNKPIVAAL